MNQQSIAQPEILVSGQSHDVFLRTHMADEERAGSLLRLRMTEPQLELFDLSTIVIKSGSLPDAGELRDYRSDLVFELELTVGERIAVGVLVEHKSWPDGRSLMRQLLNYMTRLYERGMPAVLPITIYNGRDRWPQNKSFRALQHGGLPPQFLREFEGHLIDFETIFVDLREAQVRERVRQLPEHERLVLEVLANIWEADAGMLAEWMLRFGGLVRERRSDYIGSVYNYYAKVHQSITIQEIEQALADKRSGAATMQEKQIIDEIMQEWNGVLPQSYGEAISTGIERGRVEGREIGREEAACEFAQRLIQDGLPDLDIQKYTRLPLQEIQKLRNRG